MRNDHDKTNAGGADSTKKAADDLLREMNARQKADTAEEGKSSLFDKVRDMHLAATRANKCTLARNDGADARADGAKSDGAFHAFLSHDIASGVACAGNHLRAEIQRVVDGLAALVQIRVRRLCRRIEAFL